MTELLKHDSHPLFKRASVYISNVDTVLDVGCGIRPQSLVPCKRHICLEPHGEYANILRENGYEVIENKAPDGLIPVDTIVALDVIEHMEKEEGERFIRKCLENARKQIVIYTPFGFKPQEETGETDAWGFQGQFWQRHRSGWTPDEFKGWNIADEQGAFFAIYG